MKGFLSKTAGKVTAAVVVIALLAIVIVAVFLNRDDGTSNEETPQVASLSVSDDGNEDVLSDASVEETLVIEDSGEVPMAETAPKEDAVSENNEIVDVTPKKGDSKKQVIPEKQAEPENGEASEKESASSAETIIENEKPSSPAPVPEINPQPESEADSYYRKNSTIIKVINANDSQDVPTEKEATNILRGRGFTDFPVTSEFSMGGSYYNATEISDSSADKHPIYQTFFVSDSGEVWTVFVINGDVFANPASFNLESELPAQLLFSESEELTSYDNVTNKFYVTVPKESAVIVKTVETIDSETLNQLTSEEIGSL